MKRGQPRFNDDEPIQDKAVLITGASSGIGEKSWTSQLRAVIGALKNLSTEDYRRQFETNGFESCELFTVALPEIEKTKGNIVILGSVAGSGAMPEDFALQNE